ncbi:hypothetical protein EVAR_91634_1 [Eumeta japonica]|uniref:Uncharacterized protein n=1 Tax=Eumeta variegata TaxID=151549 RepID=A0A4C2A560_EUMVA|nr:hypothetical protein EVAR_91634_1 [Eumeta japonica]
MSVSPAILIVFFFTYRTSIRSTAELSPPAAPQSLIPFTERAERRTAPHTRCPDGFPLCSGNLQAIIETQDLQDVLVTPLRTPITK